MFGCDRGRGRGGMGGEPTAEQVALFQHCSRGCSFAPIWKHHPYWGRARGPSYIEIITAYIAAKHAVTYKPPAALPTWHGFSAQ